MSTKSKTVQWTIQKAAGSFSLSSDSVSLDYSHLQTTVTVNRAGNGEIQATSANTNVATVQVSGTNVIISAVDNGSTTISVTVGAGTNHTAVNTAQTINVNCSLISTTLNDNSWDVISQVAQAGEGNLYWNVGDAKEVTLNGTIGDSNTGSQTYTNKKLCVFILDFNHKMNGTVENNIIFGGFKTALTGGKDVALMSFKINSGNTTANGWKGCNLRFSVLGNGSAKNTDATQSNITSPKANTMMSAIPSDMRNVVRLWNRWTDNTGGYTGGTANGNSANKVTQVTDCCSLLAECEIFASRSYANTGEASHSTRMAYYTAGNSTKKFDANNTSLSVDWWECSPAGNYNGGNYTNYFFCNVDTNGTIYCNITLYTYGLAPAWKI